MAEKGIDDKSSPLDEALLYPYAPDGTPVECQQVWIFYLSDRQSLHLVLLLMVDKQGAKSLARSQVHPLHYHYPEIIV